MVSVKLKPVEIWAIVQFRTSGKREIIGTFDNFDDADKTFMDIINAPRRYHDDVFLIEIIRTIECENVFSEPLVHFTHPLMETIPSPESEKGFTNG